MQFQFGYKHMSSSDNLRVHAERKITEKVEKFATKPQSVHVTFEVERHVHRVHISIKGGDGFSFDIEHAGQDMYACIDQAVDKLEGRLRKQKERLKDHKNTRLVDSKPYQSSHHHDLGEIDAADILAFENARRRRAG